MKKFLLLLALISCAALGRAQNGVYTNYAINSQGLPIPSALVRVCQWSATPANPCNTVGITIYSDFARLNTLANPFNADGLGNFNFKTAPGRYTVQISGPRVNTYSLDVLVPPEILQPIASGCATWSSLGQLSGTGLPCGTAVGTVTTTGSPASPQMAVFSGATSVTGYSGFTWTNASSTLNFPAGSIVQSGDPGNPGFSFGPNVVNIGFTGCGVSVDCLNFGTVSAGQMPITPVGPDANLGVNLGVKGTGLDTLANLNIGATPVLSINSSGLLTKYNNQALLNGQVCIGDTGAGNCQFNTFATGNGISVTAGAHSDTFALGSLTASLTMANGNNPWAINCAETTDAQDCVAFGETSAATNGTLTNGLANQAIVSSSTATNSTATPLEVAQGSITNTVATPIAQFEGTWNNAGLTGEGVIVNVTDTNSAVGSILWDLRKGNTSQFKVDKVGNITNLGGQTLGTSGQWNVSSAGLPTVANGTTLGGMGLTEVLPTTGDATSSSASIGTTNIFASLPATGFYRLHLYMYQNAGCSNPAGGNVSLTVNWSDDSANPANSYTNASFMQFTSGAHGVAPSGDDFLTLPIEGASGTAISYSTTYTACTTGTATYNARFTLERLK